MSDSTVNSDSQALDISAVRPRFQVRTSHSSELTMHRMNAYLGQEQTGVKGKVYSTYGKLSMPVAERHFWSPQLSFTMEEDEEGTTIRGLIGPAPSVWTLFMFFYAAIAFAMMVVGMVGGVRYSLGESSTILWLMPILALLFSTFYLIAYLGKKKARREMLQLLQSFEAASGLRVDR